MTTTAAAAATRISVRNKRNAIVAALATSVVIGAGVVATANDPVAQPAPAAATTSTPFAPDPALAKNLQVRPAVPAPVPDPHKALLHRKAAR